MAIARGTVPVCFRDIDNERIPRHIAMIMDGNGRWAKERGKGRTAGHRAGMERMVQIVRVSSDIGVDILSLYAFSTENWKRPKTEIDVLFSLLVEFIRREINELHRNNVKLNIIGDFEALPSSARESVRYGVALTRGNDGLILNIALNYGARHEIVQAARKLAAQVQRGILRPEEINESLFAEQLETACLPDPDLLIRTGGEQRLSNFMLFQNAYTEMSFPKCYWPDFTNEMYAQCIKDFSRRERRFGAVGKEEQA